MLKVLMVLLNKKFNRREAISTAAKISVSTGLAAVAGGVVGYSAGSLTAPRDTIITRTVTQTVTGAPEKVELQVWDIETDPGPYDAMEKAIEVFETEYPNVTVKREAKSLSEQTTAVMAALQAGRGGDVIVVNNGETMMGPLVRAGLIIPLDSYAVKYGWFKKAFSPYIWKRAMYSRDGSVFGVGNLYAVSFRSEIVGVFYNKNIFRDLGAGLPQTLQELEDVLDRAKRAGYIPLAIGGLTDWPFFHLFGAIQASFLAHEFGSPLKAQEYIDDIVLSWREDRTWVKDGNKKAIQKIQDWIKKGYFPEGFTGMTIEEALASFKAGKAAVFLQGNWYAAEIAEALGPKNVGFFPVPPIEKGEAMPPQIGGMGTPHGISIFSPHQDIAAKFLDLYMLHPEVIQTLVAKGVLPAVPVPLERVERDTLMYDTAVVFNKTLERGTMWHYLDWTTPTMWDTMSEAGFLVYSLEIEPDEFVRRVEEDYRAWQARKPKPA
ncbi:MAG: extracellular solute-binding protein [Nitrososphaerota archaeon]